jgi:hypothetical protein
MNWSFTMKTILVQMADREWTAQAVCLACAMARKENARVLLLRLVYTQHPGWLGTDYQQLGMTLDEWDALKSYKEMAAGSGVELIAQPMQYNTLIDALAQAADEVNALVVFARVPQSRIPHWRGLQLFWLENHLHAARRQLYTLDTPVEDVWSPRVTADARR